MKNQISKITVSLAIGILVGVFFGKLNSTTQFYSTYNDGKKQEVSKSYYLHECQEGNRMYFIKESTFNISSASTYGLITFSAFLILFFSKDVIQKNEK